MVKRKEGDNARMQIMNKQELLALIAQGESENREFKSSFDNETIETIASFSNAAGGGLLFCLRN